MKVKTSGIVQFLGLLALGIGPSLAHGGSISLSESLTDHSSITMSGQLDPGTHWLWLNIQKVGDPSFREDVFPVLNGIDFSKTLYFRAGPGQYVVSAYQKATEPQFGPGYYLIHAFPVENQDPRAMSFLLPSDMVQSDDPAILAMALMITEGKGGDYEKSLAIHDWVSSHVAYDTDALFAGKVKNYSASETLVSLKAFCSGYTHLNAALHRAVGIPAKVINGKASFRNTEQAHAWNEILLNGKWTIEDTTWDAGGLMGGSNKFEFHLSHEYFNPSPEVFAKDHSAGSVMNW